MFTRSEIKTVYFKHNSDEIKTFDSDYRSFQFPTHHSGEFKTITSKYFSAEMNA